MARKPTRDDCDVELLLLPLEGVVDTASVVVKKAYTIGERHLSPAPPVPLALDGPLDPVGSDLPHKRATDVVAIGSAHAPGARPFREHRVRISVAQWTKRFAVFGPRMAEWKDGGAPVFDGPELVDSVPLTVEHAYGGTDAGFPEPKPASLGAFLTALALPLGAYPRNPYGRGYALRGSVTRSTPLPLVENHEELLRPDQLLCEAPQSWYRQPLPWFSEWQRPGCFPRSWYAGVEPRFLPPEDVVLTEVRGGFVNEAWRSWRGDLMRPGGLPAAFFQEAALGLTIQGLAPAAPIVVEGMSPDAPRLELALPEPPSVEIQIAASREHVPTRLLNVVLVPHERTLVITWAAERSTAPHRFIREIQREIPVRAMVDGVVVEPRLDPPFWQAYEERKAVAAVPARGADDALVELGTVRPIRAQRDRDQRSRAEAVRVGDVDAITGRVLVEEVDFALPGAAPFVFERFYSSAMVWRAGALGRGWSHVLEQEVWEESGWIMCRLQDGREVGIPLPTGTLGIGASVHHPIAGVSIHRTASDGYEVRRADGRRARFGMVEQAVQVGPPPARLVRAWSADGVHVDVRYDVHGRVDRLVLPSGQSLRFEHDARGRLVRIFQPTRDGRDSVVAARYEISPDGELAAAYDGAGRAATYRYRNGLLTHRAPRSGVWRSYELDGWDTSARCVVESAGEGGGRREYSFDPRTRVVGSTDALGKGVSFRCNADHGVERFLDSFANETTREFDATTGLLARQVTRDGETLFLYDAYYHLADVSLPGGGTIALEHDAAGHLTSWTDPDGHTARWGWDQLGRLGAAIDRNGGSRVYDYDGEGPLASLLTPGDVRITLERDPASRAVIAVRAATGERRATHDALSRVLTVTDESGATTRFGYDPSGRVSLLELPVTACAFESDAEGRVTRFRDDARDVSIERDGFGRVLAIVEGEAGPRLHRDAEGRVSMVESEALDYWELVRDAAGRVIEETGYRGETRYALRDHRGRVIRATGATSRTEVARDAMGRPVRLEHASGLDQRLEWTHAGRLASAHEGDRRVGFERDGEGRPTLETQDEHWVRSVYDAAGRRVAIDSSLGLSVRVERDVLGGAVSIVARQGQHELELRLERDACGRERVRHLPGGLRLIWQRDAIGRAVERSVLFGEQQLGSSRFAWRGRDRLVRVEETQRGAMDYVHDARGRLVQVRMGMGSVERALDEVGNVYRVRERDDHRYAPGGRVEEAYGIEYRYDGDGRRIEKVTPLGETIRYRWDSLGRLSEVALSSESRVVFDYDGLGRRTRRRLEQRVEVPGIVEPVWEALRETRYVWDGLSLLHEIDGDGVTTWLWEEGVVIGELTADGAFAVVTDPAGMPTEIVDAGGNLVWRGSVDIFGVLQRDVANVDCPWRFNGHFEDPDTGLSHSLFRVYDPETAAYLSATPLGVAGGPNLYAYLPDPVSARSPLGLGPGYAAFGGELPSERLGAELVDIVVRALDRADGAAGPRSCFDREAARWRLPDPEAALWGPWEGHRVSRNLPHPASSFTRAPPFHAPR